MWWSARRVLTWHTVNVSGVIDLDVAAGGVAIGRHWTGRSLRSSGVVGTVSSSVAIDEEAQC